MPVTDVLPEVGEVVRVRSRRYLVEDVIPPVVPGEEPRLRLACLDDDAQGESLEVLWNREVDARPQGPPSWTKLTQGRFDPPRLFSAYYHTLLWNRVTSTDPKLFQAPHRAGIEVLAYQLEPLRKALLLPRVNLFIADDVGLGKTIEAGLIVRELIQRQRVRKIVVACPPSIVPQWRDELLARFGLAFVVMDREYINARRRERGFSVNPWKTHSRFIISHARLREEEYAAPLRDWLGDFDPGAMLILDEAHNAAPASGARYAVDSNFTRAVRDLAPRFEHRLFLSATPHNGHSNSFAALLEILDPQRFCRGVPVKNPKVLDEVMVRRLKGDLRSVGGDFPVRDVQQIDIDGLPENAPELRLSELLARYRGLRESRSDGGGKRHLAAAMLVIVNLQKRLLSSIEAFAVTLRAHRRGLDRARSASSTATTSVPVAGLSLLRQSPGADDERAELTEEDVGAEEDASIEAVTAALPGSLDAERALLDEMTTIAEGARGRPDRRVAIIADWARQNPDRRAIIFTEYADTKRYLVEQLRTELQDIDPEGARIATFHGGMGADAREAVKTAFNKEPGAHPLRLLVATDAAREGVNLQNHCADLFHFDVPWNPSRMEQRNGRIDRKLQREKEVRCRYFVLRQRPEDAVLEALVDKTKRIHKELGSLSPVVERRLASLVENGIARSEIDRLRTSIRDLRVEEADKAVVEEELEVARERQDQLRGQIETLRSMLDGSRRYLGLDDRSFADAISVSLGLLGADPLQPVQQNAGTPRFELPTLEGKPGVDPSWAETLDALRAPRAKDVSEWEWRRTSPIRPVTFEDPGTLDADTVHLHLEHRVVRRLLGRFLAQGFVHDDLARSCVTHSKDSVRRVVLLGRLSLYGKGATRLHDEVVAVAAAWTEPEERDRKKERLRPYERDAKRSTRELLDEALIESATHDAVPEPVKSIYARSAKRDLDELRPYLKTHAEPLVARASRELSARGIKESEAMQKLLEQQKTQIQKAIAKYESDRTRERQTIFANWAEEERRQLDADRRHWDKRLAAIEKELVEEPDRIRAQYVVHASPPIEPIGLVYLHPVTG